MGEFKVLFEGYKDSTIIEIRPWAFAWDGQAIKNHKLEIDKSIGGIVLINFRKYKDTFNPEREGVLTHTGHNIQFGDGPHVGLCPTKGFVKYNSNLNLIHAKYDGWD